MNRLAFAQLGVQPGERVLEVGFGGAELAGRLLAAGADVTGVDVSEAMVARARRRFRREIGAGRACFFAGSAEALPLPDGAVDKAASVNVIYFWNEPEAVMREFARVIRRGGRLVLCFQTPEAVRSWPGHRYGFSAYGADEVTALLRVAGFGPVAVAGGSDKRVGDFLCLTSERM